MPAAELEPDDLIIMLATMYVDEDDADELLATAVAQVNRWLERGDGVAVYENQDLGHPQLGHIQIVSYGSEASMLYCPLTRELPTRMPDINGAINWRYQLYGTYRGEALKLVSA